MSSDSKIYDYVRYKNYAYVQTGYCVYFKFNIFFVMAILPFD